MQNSPAHRAPLNWWRIGRVAIVTLVYFFLLVPIIVVLPLSFSSGSFLSYPLPGLSFRWYAELVNNYKWLLALQNSAIIGIGSAVLSTILGLMAAVALNGMAPRLKALLTGLLIAPLVVPLIIMAVAMFLFLSNVGLTGSIVGMILAHAVVGTPYVVISANAALQNFDMTLIRAAKSLGASPWMAYRKVLFPMIRPAIVAGTLFAFVASFDEVVISLFLAGPEQVTLPIRLFEGIRDELTPVVIAAATVMITISVGSMLLIEALRKRGEALRARAGD